MIIFSKESVSPLASGVTGQASTIKFGFGVILWYEGPGPLVTWRWKSHRGYLRHSK